jgi:hypothetical protein
LYRVIEKNSQAKNAHRSTQFGNAALRSLAHLLFKMITTLLCKTLHHARARENQHEYWRFLITQEIIAPHQESATGRHSGDEVAVAQNTRLKKICG